MRSRRKAVAAKLPRFGSDEAFVRFVESHDLAEYWAEFQEVRPLEMDAGLVRSIDRRARRKKLISLRLEAWQLRLAKAEAARQGIPYNAVLRRWIERGIRSGRAVS